MTTYAIIQYDNRELTGDYLKFTEKNKEYCIKYNYEYIFYNSKYDMPVYWIKVKLAKDLLETNKYKGVLWIDTDAVIHNFDRPIDDICIENKSMYICPDRRPGSKAFNAGVWLILSDTNGKQIMNEWMSLYYNIKHNWKIINGKYSTKEKYAGDAYEQGAFIKHILTNLVLNQYIKVIDVYVFQGMHVDIDKYGDDVKILHFCGIIKKKYMKDYLNNTDIREYRLRKELSYLKLGIIGSALTTTITSSALVYGLDKKNKNNKITKIISTTISTSALIGTSIAYRLII